MGKKTVKLSLFAYDMIIYVEIQKLIEVANEGSKVPEYKFNTQKLFSFMYSHQTIRHWEFNNTICINIKTWNI